MSVLERSELEASPLADLHAIADQLGLDGFRRLRKDELIDAILSHDAQMPARSAESAASAPEQDRDGEREAGESSRGGQARRLRRPGRSGRPRARRLSAARAADETTDATEQEEDRDERAADDAATGAEGVVEVLGNGSAFLRISPPDPSDADVYISAAQVRRCELVSGDRVSGPVRAPRRSERYPSLVRIETINGETADTVAEHGPYEELPVAQPSDRLALDSDDPTLAAIEWLTPIGLGSRVVICGVARSGKTTILRRLSHALAARADLQVTLVLSGSRPEEVAEWQQGPVAPSAALTFAASADVQGQAIERAIEAAKRAAARGADAVVLIDGLDGLHLQAARKALAAARNLRDAGSLTLIATASRPLGGETTVIALDLALTSTGRQPILDLVGSGTLRPELLVGEDGARAITSARAAALDSGS